MRVASSWDMGERDTSVIDIENGRVCSNGPEREVPLRSIIRHLTAVGQTTNPMMTSPPAQVA